MTIFKTKTGYVSPLAETVKRLAPEAGSLA
jgi:hypothetical protein